MTVSGTKGESVVYRARTHCSAKAGGRLLRSAVVRLAVAVAMAGVLAVPASAQMYLEFSGGWNHVPPQSSASGSVLDAHGSNVRGAVGKQIGPRFSLRLEVGAARFNDPVSLVSYSNCATPSCDSASHASEYSGNVTSTFVTGVLSTNTRVEGFLLAGVGAVTASGTHQGATFGAGLALPLHGRLKAVLDARWIGPLSSRAVAPWIVPVSIGLRY